MILERNSGVVSDGETRDGDPEDFESGGGGRLVVTVVFTTIEGTLAGLHAAAFLSKGLGARIVIVVTEVLSLRHMIQGLADSVGFLERLCQALVTEAKIPDVSIEVHLCRDQIRCLQSLLNPQSIILIGARQCWCPWRERRLLRALNRLGFDALMVQASPGRSRGTTTSSCRTSGANSSSVVRRMLEAARQSPVQSRELSK